MITTISPAGLAFTTEQEGGCVLHVYKDETGRDTIYVGHLIRPGEVFEPPFTVEAGMTILAQDMSVEIAAVVALSRKCSLVFTQGMFDALCDLAFNEGPGVCLDPAQSHLAAALVAGDKDGACAHLVDWDKDVQGGTLVVSPGLLARRKAEQVLFMS